ncbi:MAG: hypothetical protein RLZ35_511 [Pseudomonadota bacterium]|jgi:hypothetical protein
MCNINKLGILALLIGIFISKAHSEEGVKNFNLVKRTIENKLNESIVPDPTKPFESKISKKSYGVSDKPKMMSFDVQMISYQPQGRSFAVINGKRFIEGDVFDETTIQKIEKNKIILSNPDKKPLTLEYETLAIKKSGGKQK